MGTRTTSSIRLVRRSSNAIASDDLVNADDTDKKWFLARAFNPKMISRFSSAPPIGVNEYNEMFGALEKFFDIMKQRGRTFESSKSHSDSPVHEWKTNFKMDGEQLELRLIREVWGRPEHQELSYILYVQQPNKTGKPNASGEYSVLRFQQDREYPHQHSSITWQTPEHFCAVETLSYRFIRGLMDELK